ncbi:extracellular solute-binding protein family 5 [Granulicella tundricola MP5ACTX9]|uniref:Extracellular solute-binding protein family 5 n=2 Tax=Granulicella TaxID=940557 RepID=E8X359_GRATM|nr:extracellular solute-binding protein family 5 [Granulicella tundricola MP5ACTX9]
MMLGCLSVLGCHTRSDDAGTVVVLIESSPNSLDPRVGTDAQAEKIDGLIFDALVRKDERYEFKPWLATSWERPDATTWVFHLRDGVRFQDGRPLGAEDVAWTINSMVDGTLITAKGGNFASVQTARAKDRLTVEVKMKRADESLLFNLSDGLFGVVPKGSGREFGRVPVGSGAFRFVSAEQDKEVVLERVPSYWAGSRGNIERLRLSVVPDAVTSALELRKHSADVAVNVVTLDMVRALERVPGLKDETGPGSPVMYMNFNVTAAPLNDKRVRQAVAFAMDRKAIVDALWLGRARVADTLLPPGHWAAAAPGELTQYPHDPARAAALLEAAGYHADKDGVRLRLEMKTSTDETTRLLAEILQQQLRAAGIALTLRSSEFGTFYADVTRGAFQMYALRWIWSNEDPDIFHYAFATSQMPPVGGNRGRYSNARVDSLLAAAATTPDVSARRADYVEVQKILADELPAIPLWYPNNNIVHTDRVSGIVGDGSGSFDFLRDAVVK